MPITKPPPRQILAKFNRLASQAVLDNGDQAYGRQLATMHEREALILRARFGGVCLWGDKPLRERARPKKQQDDAAWAIRQARKDHP